MYLSPRKQLFVDTASDKFGGGSILNKSQVKETCDDLNIPLAGWFLGQCKVGYNQFKLPNEEKYATETVQTNAPAPVENTTVNLVATNMDKQNLVPAAFEGFVPWGHYSTIKQIVESGLFYPVFVTGLSGNGKTLMIEQIHAKLKKELIRVNITIETDEDDLLGGFRLVNGETKFVPGPVIEAMEKGCTLLLDECDLGSNKLLALQPVLEGKGVYLKKVNKWVTPKQGFNVMATANTKGKGSEDGRFIGTNILNEAFLERFAITIEQPYATTKTEKKIVIGSMKKYGKVDESFADNLTKWADVIRKTFFDGGVDEVISTRRLDHIVKAFAIFGDKMKAIDLCVARFDDETKDSFKDLYTKIDSGVDISTLTSDDSSIDAELAEMDEEEDDADF
jgi:hypothetical protein|tara:strand:- start:248 stop:1426 length:1179 start_codon:yes stop_codon:yes gene_type:complete